MEYRILGPVQVWSGGVPRYLGGPREHRVLAVLLLNADRVVAIDRLIRVLWGEKPPPTATGQVRNTIAALSRHLAAAREAAVSSAPIVRSGAGFILGEGPDELDHLVFERRVARAQTLAAQGNREVASAELGAALRLWRGPALGGLGAPVLDAEAHRLEDSRLACLELRIELDLSLGRAPSLAGELAVLVRAHPRREALVELQIRALHAAGRRQEALEVYTTAVRRRLAGEPGLEPRPELVRLHPFVL